MKPLSSYFKLNRAPKSNKFDSTGETAGFNKYLPHQGKQEIARRKRNSAKVGKVK